MSYDPQAVTQKQIRRAQAAAQDYQDGVQNTDKNPMALAIAKKAKMRAKLIAAIDNGKWEDGLRGVAPEDWKAITVKKGGRNYASGVADSEAKTLAFHQQFSAFLKGVQAKINAMPDETPEQADQRMLANVRELRKFKRSRRT